MIVFIIYTFTDGRITQWKNDYVEPSINCQCNERHKWTVLYISTPLRVRLKCGIVGAIKEHTVECVQLCPAIRRHCNKINEEWTILSCFIVPGQNLISNQLFFKTWRISASRRKPLLALSLEVASKKRRSININIFDFNDTCKSGHNCLPSLWVLRGAI